MSNERDQFSRVRQDSEMRDLLRSSLRTKIEGEGGGGRMRRRAKATDTSVSVMPIDVVRAEDSLSRE